MARKVPIRCPCCRIIVHPGAGVFVEGSEMVSPVVEYEDLPTLAGFPEDWREQLYAVTEHAVEVKQEEQGPGSLGDVPGLSYKVVPGDVMNEKVSWVRELVLLFLRHKASHDVVFLPDPMRAVNLNIIEQQGYELHTDGNSWTGVLFLETVIDDIMGGEIVMPEIGKVISPVAGNFVLFNGDEIAHKVAPVLVGVRHTLVLGFIKPDEPFDLEASQELSRYLYTSQ